MKAAKRLGFCWENAHTQNHRGAPPRRASQPRLVTPGDISFALLKIQHFIQDAFRPQIYPAMQ